MKGSPYPDKKSRAEKKAIRKFKRETVTYKGKTYNKKELEENARKIAEAKVNALQNQ